MSGMRLCVVAVAVSVAAALAAGAPQAHATPLTAPCGYECLWPIGSYEIPGSMAVGEATSVKYTYAWEEAPGNGAVGTQAQRELPPGRHAWPEEWGEPARPNGYAGSAVTLVLPEGVGVDGWERRGFERSEAWTDYYGRTTYRYSGLNAYAEGVSAASVELVVEADAVIYPDDKVWIDLGVRGAEWRSPVAYLNRAGDAVSVSAEPAGAAGSGGNRFPNRGLHVLPESAVAPLDEGSLGVEARRAIVELLLERADSGARLDESDVPEFARAQVMARVGGEATGGAGESGVVYAYGIVKAQNERSPAFGVLSPVASPAEGVKMCAHEVTDSGIRLLTNNGVPACSIVDAGGFFVIPVPVNSADPGGVFTAFFLHLENELVKVVEEELGVDTVLAATSTDRYRVTASPATVALGEYTVPVRYGGFSEGYVAFNEVMTAHKYFSEAVGYDAPLVTIRMVDMGQQVAYTRSTSTITLEDSVVEVLSFRNDVVLHEYGHHIMNHVYERGSPTTQNCSLHTPDRASSPSCAWTEGWASFVSSLVRDSPAYTLGADYDTPTIYDWEAHEVQLFFGRVGALDARTGSTVVRDYHLGEDGEGSVAAILWDVYDGLGEPGDDVSAGVREMWAAFASAREGDEVRPAVDIHGFYDDWSDAGGQNLDSVFAINGVDVTPRFTPPSLGLSVERDGVARSGDYAAYARGGDEVVARLDLGRPASAGTAPTVSLFGGAPSPMSPVGDGGREWASRVAVPGGAPGGAASVTIRAMGPGLAAAGSQAVEHSDGSGTVTLRLASVPIDGEYDVTARASVADSGGTTLASDQSLTAEWNAARPAVDAVTISPDGREITLALSEGIGGVVGQPCVSTLRSGNLPAVDWLHVPGSNVIKLHLARAPADTRLLEVCGATITDTQGHLLRNGLNRELWNPEAPAFEHVTVSPDGRTLTLTFSEKVRVYVGPVTNQGILTVTNGQTHSETHTVRLAQALDPGTYSLPAPIFYTDYLAEESRLPTFGETRTFTYNPSGPTFDHVKASPDGMTLTLTFSEGMDGGHVTRDRFTLGDGLALAGESPIAHVDGSRTVSLRLAAAPSSDGTYEVAAKGTIQSAAGVALGTDQERTFTWNPEAPTFDHVEVSPDGMTLTLTFSEGLHSSTLRGRIGMSAGLDLSAGRHTHGSDKVLLELARAPDAGTHHVYVPREVADVAGRQMAVRQERSFSWDASPPAFESVKASADGRTLTLTFSEGLDARTVTTCDVPRVGTSCPLASRATTTGNFALSGGLEFRTEDAGGNAARPILHTDGGSQVTIRLASAPPAAGTYEVTAKSGIRDTTNVAMGSDQKRSFTWAPGIPALESASFSSDGRAVTLGFSEGLDSSTVTADSVSIDGGSAALLVTQRAAGAGGVTVDTAAPRLLDALFTSTGEVRLEFSEPLDHTTVTTAAFEVSPEGGEALAATPSYTAGERAVTLTLASAAAAGVAHDVSVRTTLADRAGNPVAAATVSATPPSTASSAPTFTARAASSHVTVVTFGEDVRLIEGQELDPRDWDIGGHRAESAFVDLENRKVFVGTGVVPPSVRFSPYSGSSPKIESVAGHDLPVRASAIVPGELYPSFFADAVEGGKLELSFDLALNPRGPRDATGAVSGTTAASEWRVNGATATGLSAEEEGAPVPSITVSNAESFYLHHGVTGVDGTLQVEYVGAPDGSPNALVNSDRNALEPTKVTSVDRIPNTVMGAEFLDSRTVKFTATKAVDPRLAGRFQVSGAGTEGSASLIDGSDQKSVIVRVGVGAQDGCTYSLRVSNSFPAMRIDLGEAGRQKNQFVYVDTHAPVIRSATTSGTATDVMFNEPVSFGALPTLAQHRGHWSVEVGGAAMEIASVAVSEDDASTVTIRHAALPRKDAAPTVKYDGSADDDAQVRDTRASQCTDTDAPSKNEQDGMLEVVASDGAAPGAVAVSAEVLSDGGVPKSGPNALWAGIGDTVSVSLAMDEDGRESSPPRLIAAGSRAEMSRGETARLWSGGVVIGAGAAQGDLGYTITAPDAAGNLGVFVDAEGAEPIARIDTVLPEIASAETAGAGVTRVTLTEGAWGTAVASDWAVGGMRATGVSAGGGGFAPAVALSGGTLLVLAHPELVGTGGTPEVVYGAPGGTPGAGSAPDPLPGPPRAGIALDVGGLDGAEVRLGETRSFGVSATVGDGGAAVVHLSGQPGFVTVENTDINRARVTVDASHESAAAGEHTFTVIAATGSDPATRQVTVTVL